MHDICTHTHTHICIYHILAYICTCIACIPKFCLPVQAWGICDQALQVLYIIHIYMHTYIHTCMHACLKELAVSMGGTLGIALKGSKTGRPPGCCSRSRGKSLTAGCFIHIYTTWTWSVLGLYGYWGTRKCCHIVSRRRYKILVRERSTRRAAAGCACLVSGTCTW